MRKTRPYRSEQRTAAAVRTRTSILGAAKQLFETRGWTGATVPLIAQQADVSVSSVEAIYKTKAALLGAVVDFSIRGDVGEETMDHRPVFARIRTAPDAATMLSLHSTYVRAIHERAAIVAWVVEQAAGHDKTVAELWDRMTRNRAFGANAAAKTLMTKRGIRSDLTHATARNVFWLAIDSGTYRSLTQHAGLTPDEFEDWIVEYYRRMLL